MWIGSFKGGAIFGCFLAGKTATGFYALDCDCAPTVTTVLWKSLICFYRSLARFKGVELDAEPQNLGR